MERESLRTVPEYAVNCASSSEIVFGDGRKFIFILKFLFVTALLILSNSPGFSQSKYEKEFRIKESEVPLSALSFVDSMNFDTKIKWYKEIGLTQITFEAKAISNKERHSIEFCEDGIFQDIEIEVDSSKIPYSIYSKISELLAIRHKKYKIEKIQMQYAGDRGAVLRFLREKAFNSEDITISYEFIISTKMDGNYLMLEYLFSDKGEYVQSNQIVSKRKDTIDY